MAQSTAHRRLLQEYRALTNNPPEGITAGPVSEDDLLHWEALIQGPEGTPFEGGVFAAELRFPRDYPLAPPSMKFIGDVFHPNSTSLPPPSPSTSADHFGAQSTPPASSAYPSCTRPATTLTTTSTRRSGGRPSSRSKRF